MPPQNTGIIWNYVIDGKTTTTTPATTTVFTTTTEAPTITAEVPSTTFEVPSTTAEFMMTNSETINTDTFRLAKKLATPHLTATIETDETSTLINKTLGFHTPPESDLTNSTIQTITTANNTSGLNLINVSDIKKLRFIENHQKLLKLFQFFIDVRDNQKLSGLYVSFVFVLDTCGFTLFCNLLQNDVLRKLMLVRFRF